METITSIKPLLAVSVSLVFTLLIACAGKRPNLREGWTFLAAFIKFGIVASMVPVVLNNKEIVCKVVEILPGVGIGFRVDSLGLLFALVSSSLWIVTSAYSIGYMRGLDEHSQTRYFCFFCQRPLAWPFRQIFLRCIYFMKCCPLPRILWLRTIRTQRHEDQDANTCYIS
jgi:multicomponent Na+:H+ antiporter subunit D